MTWLSRTTAVVLGLAALALVAGRYDASGSAFWKSADSGGSSCPKGQERIVVGQDSYPGEICASRGPATISVQDKKDVYLDKANKACYDGMSGYPTSKPKNTSALMKQQDKVAEVWFASMQALAAVPVPHEFTNDVKAVLEAQNDAYAAFLEAKEAFREGEERGWYPNVDARFDAARSNFNRRLATAVQRTEAFGLSHCARTWWNWK